MTSQQTRQPKHTSEDRNFLAEIVVSDDVKGKDVVVFDDITTSGQSANHVERLLLQKGALTVNFIFLGRTFRADRYDDRTVSREVC